jgi:hypothetical protein
VEATLEALEPFGAEVLSKVMGGNAMRVYGLDMKKD